MGTTALAFGGCNQSLFLIGALLATQGTAAVPLLAVGLLLSWMAVPGWTELVMMWPNRVGGIAATCSEAFRPYSPVLANLTGTCYWWGWVPTCGLTAMLSASAVQQWYLPWVPVKVLAALIIVGFTIVNLVGVRWVARFAVGIASASSVLALLSALIPVMSGRVDWRTASSFHLTLPFHGTFAVLTSAMAGLYLIGFAAPAFEAATCHVGETRRHEREVPRAIFASAGIASLYFVILPVVWLGVLGPQALGGDLATSLGPTFAPLLGAAAKAAALWFMVFNMFHGTLQPLAGASRTLAQLSEDGLLPRSLSRRNRYDCPWVATILTAAASTALLISGDPPAVIAAANLTYLISICLPSVAVWLLRRHAPEMERPWRAPRFTIGLGLVAAGVWGASTLLGFQQFGIKFVLLGLGLAYSGSLAYSWRTWQDRRASGVTKVRRSLGMKLTGAMVLVMILDGAGYLLAVDQVENGHPALVAVLQDIFVAVALLTITVGLVLPGMISHAVAQVNDAAQRLQGGTLAELTRALRALGSGDLAAAQAHPKPFKVDVRTKDEVAAMAASFNAMQDGIIDAAISLDAARKQLQAGRARLEFLASHDPLTGLANRRHFDELLERRVQQTHPSGEVSVLSMFDLDNFKMINDSRGHLVGDEVLKLVAEVLRDLLPPDVVVARLGGDEFAFLMTCPDTHEAMAVTQRVITALHEHTAAVAGGQRVRVSASAGTAVFDGTARVSAVQLMMDVDVAMYEAKDAGGNRVVLASRDGAARKSLTTRQEWLDTLNEALAGRGFELYAQPIKSLADGTITRYELLLRLIGADGSVISPGEFLPAAERHGLIREIDRWVVAHAFTELRRRLQSDPAIQFEVNLSGLSIGDQQLEALIAQEMSFGDVPNGAMVFEITETAAIVDLAAAAAFAQRIANLGCGWALDDFGAGFSSFLYLKSLPFSYVKIDGSFVRQVATNPQDRQVVQAIVQIAASMGLLTIAEFVEDAETLETLRDLDVDFAQGYHIGRPAPLSLQNSAHPAPDQPSPAASPQFRPFFPVQAAAEPASSLAVLERAAAAVGAVDILVFRRVVAGRLVHIGGLGRGADWAGNIDLDEEILRDWPRHVSDPARRWRHAQPAHVLGPYHARQAAVLAASNDTFIVLGAPGETLSQDDDELRHVALLAASTIQAVSPTRGLADELEILHASKAVMSCAGGTVSETAAQVARIAAESLSCEAAAIYLTDLGLAEICYTDGLAQPETADVHGGLNSLASRWAGTPLCVQDSVAAPLTAPFDPGNGVTSHLMLPLGGPVEGFVLWLHTQADPRGFTTLCAQVADAIAQAAGPVIQAAQVRHSLHGMVADAEVAARRDVLTGLMNRRGWEEALLTSTSLELPVWVAVALIDLNDLKRVNDTSGHQAGDDYLRETATRLLAASQEGDLVARIGGDEFAVLRRASDSIDMARFTADIRECLTSSARGITEVHAAVGAAQCNPGNDLAEAIQRADIAMYLEKSLTRTRTRASSGPTH